MPKQTDTPAQLLAENMALRTRLDEAEMTLRAIRSGEVDALLVAGAGGDQLLTLKGADIYRTLIEEMSEGALTLTAEGVILYANRGFAKMLKMPLEQVIGAAIHRWIAPESKLVFQSLLGKGADEKWRGQLDLLSSDGAQVPAYVSASKLRINGMPVSYSLVATDLTEQRRNDRGLLEAAPDAMVVVNTGGEIVLLNVQAEKQFGYRRDELLGQKVKNIIPEGFAERLVADSLRSVAEALAQQIGTGIELTARRKDGSEFPIELMLSPLESTEGVLVTAAIRDISKRKAAEAKIVELARTDSLTTLANRMAFIEQLGIAVAAAKRGGTPFAVLYLDLDNFKDVNDTLGHPMGDKLLQLVAERLRHDVRASDLVARFGGDEFAVLQAGAADPTNAGILAAKICKDLKSPYQLEGNTIRITVSVGICMFDAELAGVDNMLTQADLALYRAKEAGRDQFAFHSEDMNRIVQARVSLTEDLRAALERGGELEVHYQPMVEIVSGRIVGVEALVRWNHPKRGQIMPADFIAVAEKTGGITALGRWVLDESCRQMSCWRNEGIAPPVIAVNVSTVQFKVNHEFEKELAEIVAKWGLPPSYVELELTESVLMETTQEHGDLLERIRQSGVRLSIDDFGTGYSSLGYLRNYQINRLKIAQQFIFGLPRNSGDVAITRAAIILAREFDIDVIAEGVETAEQAAFLTSLGCEYAQGYYFSRPVPADRATLLLRQGRIDVGAKPLAAVQ